MMKLEQPVVAPGRRSDETVETHPAYGMIGAHRVSATHGVMLNGSDFGHRSFVKIEIQGAMIQRMVSHDFHMPTKLYTEVWLSEAQWATFVSSMNVGFGVPCTVRRVGGPVGAVEEFPGIDRTVDQTQVFTDEMRQTVQDAIDHLTKLKDAVDTLTVPKKTKDALLMFVRQSIQELEKNIPFVGKVFGDYVESTTEKAKSELNAYMQQMLARTGLTALQAGEGPIQLLDVPKVNVLEPEDDPS